MGLSGNAATPPSKETVKKILAIMLDLMEQNMRKRIAAAKARYGGIAFVGLSADTWSSRRSQGFIAIEISFAYVNASGKCCMTVMCLACRYFPGSHTKEAIAEVMRDALAKFGLDAEDVIVYVSDSGGGIPAAAKVLGLFRLACMLHLLDTITGRALGVKGLGSGARARPHGEGAHLLKEYLGRAKDQAGYWKNSNLRTEQLQEAHKENEEEREALAILLGDETVTVTPLPHVQQPVASRMWSDCAMLASINKLQRSFDKFYEKFGGAKQLPFNDRVLTPYIVSLLMVIRNAQKAVEASTYPTASFYFVIIHDLKAYYNGKSFRIYLNPNDKRATTVALTDMPQLAQYLVKNIAMELDYYFPTVQKQVAMAAFADPRVKWHPALVDHLDDLGEEFEGLLVKVLEPMLSDDPGLNGDAIDEDAVTEAGPQQVVYRSTIDALFGDDEPIVRAPTACAAPRAAAVPKPKSSHSKAVELAAQIKAWHLALPKVEKVVYGKGSGDFNVLDHISKQSLGLGKEADDAYKIVVMSLLGFRASAAGPETIFSLCGLICTALRNRISVWNIELLVFLSKNKEFIPSDDEVVEEILRLEKIQKTRKAAAAEPQNEANESEDEVYDVYDGDEEVGADGDGEVHDDCEGEEEDSDESDDGETEVELPSDVVVDRDPRPLILTEDEISGLYDDITQPRLNRGGGCDAEFEFEDFFDELMEKELGPGI